MKLTEQQTATVTAWVKEGCGLSEIQRRLVDEFGLRPTFMDVRLLILDLELEIRDKTASRSDSKTKKEALSDTPLSAADDAELPGDDLLSEEDLASDDMIEEGAPAGEGSGAVSVEVDRLVKPGALVSGTVTFSDGITAAWSLDQYGRLTLDAKQPGYRPSPEDIENFQLALQKEIAKKGY